MRWRERWRCHWDSRAVTGDLAGRGVQFRRVPGITSLGCLRVCSLQSVSYIHQCTLPGIQLLLIKRSKGIDGALGCFNLGGADDTASG